MLDLLDPNVDVVYISACKLDDNLCSHIERLLTAAGVSDVSRRYISFEFHLIFILFDFIYMI